LEDMESSQWVGDYVNRGIYSVEEASWLPESQAILLPSERIANLWNEED